MDSDTMKKVIIAVVALVVVVPFLPRLAQLIPEPIKIEAIEPAFTSAGLAVSNVSRPQNPGLGAIDEISMIVSGANVNVYRFDNRGKIATQLEYQKPDSGSTMVETWNIGASLGAAPSRNRPTSAARKGMFMIVVSGEDKALNERIVQVFRGM